STSHGRNVLLIHRLNHDACASSRKIRLLRQAPSLKSCTALTAVYAAGLRVSEVVFLKIADIDSRRMVIRVEKGKGGRNRYAMLSHSF
ncbi:tyrosine-type recombinase/integrase, partial [Bradyrhizobium sp. 141]|uniref:tyrosine-type recombinase/integrase n=1 Tax=Bradyrhizobium sp. 141 TaxID=2782617 RepID=UPI00209719BE